MAVAKKITCLGAGSFYFLRAIPDLLLSPELAGSELVLYDIDAEKAERMAAMGRRLAPRAGTGFRVRAATELADAVDGADFALSSIGGSGAEVTANVYGSSYHAADIAIRRCASAVGDTCGPAGMMMGLLVPAYRQSARRWSSAAQRGAEPLRWSLPGAAQNANLTVIGICHGVQHTRRRVPAFPRAGR